MKCLVNDLLTLVKSDNHESKPKYSSIDLSFIITGSILTWEPVAYDMGKKLEYDIDIRFLNAFTELTNPAEKYRAMDSVCPLPRELLMNIMEKSVLPLKMITAIPSM